MRKRNGHGEADYRTQDHFTATRRRVGFFGCSAQGGLLIRVAYLGRKPPRVVEVDCPHCGQRHAVAPIWRDWLPTDDAWEALVIE